MLFHMYVMGDRMLLPSATWRVIPHCSIRARVLLLD
jgi:hypothetical protein